MSEDRGDVPEARERAHASCADRPGSVRRLEGELQAGASDLEGGAHAGAAEAAETSEITGVECQWVRAAPGDASEPCVELSPLTERTEDGRQLRILVVIDEFTRECLAIEVARSFTARDVIMTRRSCSPCEEHHSICAVTMGRSSLPKRSRSGWRGRASARSISRRRARGKTATWRASTADSATSCSTGNCS